MFFIAEKQVPRSLNDRRIDFMAYIFPQYGIKNSIITKLVADANSVTLQQSSYHYQCKRGM